MALYQPTNIVPDVRSGIGEGTVDVTQGMTVTWQINGQSALTAFSISLLSNTASSTQLYTTGKITDGCPAYGTSSNGTPVPFSYTIPATALSTAGITNGNEYKLLITQWWSDNDSITQSSASVFITRNEPTLAITPIVTQAEITDLQTSIVPIQSGTGDPYPAGGGKNKLENALTTQTKNNTVFTVNADGTITVKTTPSAQARVTIKSGLAYTATGDSVATFGEMPTGTRVFCKQVLNGTTTYPTISSPNNTGINIPAGAEISDVILEINTTYGGTQFTVYPQIEAGSTATSYAPYSNIRPITGWTGANIWVDGKYGGNIYWNQFVPNGDFSNGATGWSGRHSSISAANGIATATVTNAGTERGLIGNYTSAYRIKGHKYFISMDVLPPASGYVAVGFNGGAEAHNRITVTANQWNRCSTIWDSPADVQYKLLVSGYLSASLAVGAEIKYKNVWACDLTEMFGETIADQLYAQEQATQGAGVAWVRNLFPSDYYAYNAGETTCVSAVNGNPYGLYNIDWSDEAGTVYGGTLDVTLGKLRVTHKSVTFTGVGVTWTVGTSYGKQRAFTTAISTEIKSPASGYSTDFLSNYLSPEESNPSAPDEYHAAYSSFGTFIVGVPSTITTAAQWNTYLASNNLQVVYPLATPLEYDLTPTEIQLLLKKNNIWCDTGAVDATVELVGHSTEYTGDIIEVFGGDTAIFTRYYTFTADYEQSQGDVLNYYRWLIANADNTDNPFYDSGYISGTMDLSCFYDGFLPQEDYAVKLMIQTENGVDATAGWDYFGCDYSPSSTSGVLNAKCVGGTDAIAVSWEGIGYIPGIGAGDYSISDDNILSLPSGASATWRLMGTAPMSLAAPWSVIWKGTLLGDATIFTIGQGENNIVLSYTASTGTLTLTRGGTTLASQTGAINSPTVTAILTATTLYLRVYYIGGGLYPSASLYPATTRYPIADNTPVTNTYTLSITYTQEAITSVTLGAIQECNYIEVVNGAVSADVITAAITNGTYYPEVSESDYMMANFTQGLNAGTVDVGGDYLVGYALYRQRGNDGRLIKIADTDVATSKVYDYGATTGQGPYTYYLFPVGTNTYIAAALVSPTVMPCWWNWTLMECAETDNENIYDVVAAYRFRLNIESGAVTNNNAPSVLANFTRYPTVQLAPQNYKAGTLTGLIGAVYWTDGQPKYRDTIQLQNAIYALSTTHNALFLKNRKGELLRVRISGAISMQTGDNTREQALTMTLPWVEIGSAENVSLYSLDYAGVQEEEKDCTTPLYEGAC